MKWIGDPENDLRLSLLDDSGTVTFGQAIQDNSGGWNAYDYCADNMNGIHLGWFSSARAAQDAVAVSVERMKAV